MPGQQCAIQCAVEQRHLTASGCGRQIALHLFEFASVLAQGLLWCEHAPAPDGLVSCVVTIVPTRSMDPDSSFILFVRAQFSAHDRMTRVVVHRCGAHLVSCGIWQVDSLWPQIVLFHHCSLAVAPASSTRQVLLQLPSLLLPPCAMLLPCKVNARPVSVLRCYRNI